MRSLFLICVSLFPFSCKKTSFQKLPSCIRDIIQNDTHDGIIKTVRAQEANGEIHFWLNTDALNIDGDEIIVNADCQTVCHFCVFCITSQCQLLYKDENWEIVWEK